MKVVHISGTPLAGLPIRIVNALNAYTNVKARHINRNPAAYGARTYPGDLHWWDDRKECEALIADADILHFYHWCDFGSDQNPFRFDFLSHMKPGARYLMQWQTNPVTVAKNEGVTVKDLAESSVPQLVSAQYHESYYTHALPVPLIVDTEGTRPVYGQREKPVFFFAPSMPFAAHEERWVTKGKPETVRILEQLRKENVLNYSPIENCPFETYMALKAQADVVIDDLANGSFHLTCLEGLALGKPTLSYVDSRTQMVLAEITGSTDLPIINVELNDAKTVMAELARNRAMREAIGKFSRDWMEKNYSAQKMIRHYVRAYEMLLNGEVLRNPRYTNHAKAKAWLYNTVPDLIWASRRKAGC